MPVDLFPPINLPQVVVATFYLGHAAAGYRDRHHVAAGAILHTGQRHRSHGVPFHAGRQHDPGVFQPGTSADADVTELSNLALADLKRLPPGTLPPVVLKSDASSLPVCLVR